MKPIQFLLVFSFLFLGISVNAQGPLSVNEVPETVKSNFLQKFPDQKVLSWQKTNENYGAVCKSDGKKTEIVFDKDGNYLSTKTQMKKGQVPVIVLSGLHSTQFNDWNVHNVDFVETSTHKSYYEIGMKKGKEIQKLSFDSEGNQLSNN